MKTTRKSGRRRIADVIERDDEILDAAFELFSKAGFHQVSLATIAEAANAAVRTIYSRFGGKLGIVRKLIAREAIRHAQQISNLVLPRQFEKRLYVLAKHLLHRANDLIYLNLQVIVITTGDCALLQECYAAGPGQFFKVLKAELLHSQNEGILDQAFSLEELCNFFIAVVIGPQLGRYIKKCDSCCNDSAESFSTCATSKFMKLVKLSQ